MDFSVKNREARLASIGEKTVDVLVIGGGITGAGIALDATTRGLDTLLVEMQDFASGTSSRSTKLIHGGLRYLKQFEVQLVSEVGKERAVVYENGPHVTTPEKMLLPIYQNGTFGRFTTSVGLTVYDFLAGVKREERRTMLNREQTLQKEPLLKQDGLLGSGFYVEYRTDDARLTIEVLKKAVEQGASAFNYMKVESFLYEMDRIVGVVAVDLLTNLTYTLYAKKIINATGPWVDSLREKDGSLSGKRLKLSKGVHIVIDSKKFPLKQAVYFDTPDGRMVFAIPRDGKTYIGTTDTFYDGDPASPRMTREDLTYLLESIAYIFPYVQLREHDIESSWAGVRPLIYEEGKSASEISRKDEIWQSPSGLITIAGGKLTGYRKMAELTVDKIEAQLEVESARTPIGCRTKYLPISGGAVGGSIGYSGFIRRKTNSLTQLGVQPEQAEKLVRLYGSNIDSLIPYIHYYNDKESELPVELFASVQYAIDHEMITNPADYLIRRTGALYFNINWVHQWKETITNHIAQQLNLSEPQKQTYLTELNQQLESTKAI